MKDRQLLVDGELYLGLEVVAEIYEVQLVWLREAYEFGLLGSGVDSGPGLCVAAVEMDRIATIVRLHKVLGMELESIALALE